MAVTYTKIAWTDATWSPIRGCSRVSTGCEYCYAERQAGRFSGTGQPYEGLVRRTSQGFKWTGDVRLIEKDLEVPLRWKQSKRIFVNSMSDLFHESVPDAWIDQIFAVMALASQHQFQILTKRPERMYAYFCPETLPSLTIRIIDVIVRLIGKGARWEGKVSTAHFRDHCCFLPLPNVWLGVSVENQATLNRLNHLCETPAAIRFASFEPLLEDLGDITPWLEPVLNAAGLDWCIVGGESGPKARPCDVAWVRSVVDQCQQTGVGCWVKQMGSYSIRMDERDSIAGPVRKRIHWQDRKGANPEEWPAAWQVQQWPQQGVMS